MCLPVLSISYMLCSPARDKAKAASGYSSAIFLCSFDEILVQLRCLGLAQCLIVSTVLELLCDQMHKFIKIGSHRVSSWCSFQFFVAAGSCVQYRLFEIRWRLLQARL